MKINEIWKDIPGYEGLYQVSDWGRVKSLNYGRTGKERIMKPILKKEYYNVSLPKRKYYRIHRLVVTTFIGPIPPGMVVNHINEDKLDNRLSNLEIVTPAENTRFSCCGRSSWNKGLKGLYSLTDEQKAKISKALKGRPSHRKGKIMPLDHTSRYGRNVKLIWPDGKEQNFISLYEASLFLNKGKTWLRNTIIYAQSKGRNYIKLNGENISFILGNK